MLSILRRGTVESDGHTWEFHGDDANDRLFYITPVPQFMMEDGLPSIEIVEYQTSDELNGSGYAKLQIELGVSAGTIDPIKAKIAEQFGVADPIFQTLAVQSGTLVDITYPDGQGGTTGMQVEATDFGANNAIAQVSLDVDQMNEVKSIMEGDGTSPFEIGYIVMVPSILPSVKMRLSFDSNIAFEYQVTEHKHEKWGEETRYTYDIARELTASNSSTVEIDKIDPNIPQSTVDQLRQWGQDIITARVREEAQQKLDLLTKTGGTQSFTANQLTSFSQTYIERETVLWRVHPVAVLPSFGQMGLTAEQRASRYHTVDARQFFATITPAVKFDSDAPPPALCASGAISAGDDPFQSDIKPLKQLEVTLHYPTVDSAEKRTHKFTTNEPHSWTAPWDESAGGVYSISYVATYDDNQQIEGQIDELDATEFTLTLADVGTLNITFNASSFFDDGASEREFGSAGSGDVDGLDINLVFEIPNAEPLLRTFTLDAAQPIKTISSLHGAPLSTYYSFSTTYRFKPEVSPNPFTSSVRRLNTQFVDIAPPDFQQNVDLFVNMGGIDGADEFVQLTANFYYEGEPVFPDIPASKALPHPTISSPIQFNFTQDDLEAANGSGLRTDRFRIFANSRFSPLVLNASAVTASGEQVRWGATKFTPSDVALLSFVADNLFVFVEIDPIIVDWNRDPAGNEDTLVRIDLAVDSATFKTPDEEESTVYARGVASIAFDPSQDRGPKAFFIVDGLDPNFYEFSFSWRATYIYAKAGSISMEQTTKGTTVALPPTPPPPAG